MCGRFIFITLKLIDLAFMVLELLTTKDGDLCKFPLLCCDIDGPRHCTFAICVNSCFCGRLLRRNLTAACKILLGTLSGRFHI